jgi:hypothetical protein
LAVRLGRRTLHEKKVMEASVKNIDSVFAAYLIGWGVFFVFYLTIAKRTADLRGEIDRLKSSVTRSK